MLLVFEVEALFGLDLLRLLVSTAGDAFFVVALLALLLRLVFGLDDERALAIAPEDESCASFFFALNGFLLLFLGDLGCLLTLPVVETSVDGRELLLADCFVCFSWSVFFVLRVDGFFFADFGRCFFLSLSVFFFLSPITWCKEGLLGCGNDEVNC